jgi:hypothetical protein
MVSGGRVARAPFGVPQRNQKWMQLTVNPRDPRFEEGACAQKNP